MAGPILSVSRVFTDTRHPSRPYAVTIRLGSLVRVERYSSRGAAKVGRAQARADLALLTGRKR